MTMYSKFQTELQVRPDDIDMFNHVHNSRYFDYVMAARYEQMERCYKMPMEHFMQNNYGWVVRTAHIEYKRPLTMGEKFVVQTGIAEINDRGCRVDFIITSRKTNKVCSDGWFDYVLINTATGRSMKVTQEMVDSYSI